MNYDSFENERNDKQVFVDEFNIFISRKSSCIIYYFFL